MTFRITLTIHKTVTYIYSKFTRWERIGFPLKAAKGKKKQPRTLDIYRGEIPSPGKMSSWAIGARMCRPGLPAGRSLPVPPPPHARWASADLHRVSLLRHNLSRLGSNCGCCIVVTKFLIHDQSVLRGQAGVISSWPFLEATLPQSDFKVKLMNNSLASLRRCPAIGWVRATGDSPHLHPGDTVGRAWWSQSSSLFGGKFREE